MAQPTRWQRRARPLLGTLVEIGVPAGQDAAAGFAAIEAAQARLSRFVPDSDVVRFAALPAGDAIDLPPDTAELLTFAAQLQTRSQGAFDITLGSGPQAWYLDGLRLHKLQPNVTLDLGGIGKGHAVDLAVAALQASGINDGWVNAGGDLRAFGDVELPVQLRDEQHGGTAPWLHICDGALATSHYAANSRCRLHGPLLHAHVSVAAPTCRWADALTKLAALCALAPTEHRPAGFDPRRPHWWPELMDDAGATAWWH